MAKRYSEEWKRNVSKGVKKSWNRIVKLDVARRKKLSEAAKKGNSQRTYKRKPIEELKSSLRIRNRLFEERGRKCERCGWAEINPFSNIIPVQVDHKDGDRTNNNPDNLEILCPNCHSLTENFMFYGRSHKGTYGIKGTERYR